MISYKKVYDFFFKNEKYCYLIDNHNKKFYLKYDSEGNFCYLTFEEYIELINEFVNIPNVMKIERENKKYNIIPKIIIGGSATVLSSALLFAIVPTYCSYQRVKKFKSDSTRSIEFDASVSTLSSLGLDNYNSYTSSYDDEFEVDTYFESDFSNSTYVYDMDYLDMFMNKHNVTLNEIKDVVLYNDKIGNDYKSLITNYCNMVYEKYPTIDKRILYENLKTLEVVECSKEQLVNETLSVDASGCYVRTKNKIYVLKGNDYSKGTWDYQVINHELSHCLRTGYINGNDRHLRVQIEGLNFDNTIIAESLNSLFTVSLFDYDEKKIAYQLQSNYIKLLVDNMDNYDLSDYAMHSESYFVEKLNEYNKNDNAASVLELIQAQYDDYHDDKITIAQSEFYPLYDYVSDMYYKKHITSDMKYDDAVKVTDELLDKLLNRTPADYNIDKTHFYNHLKEKYTELKDNSGSKRK